MMVDDIVVVCVVECGELEIEEYFIYGVMNVEKVVEFGL